ncbi:hypothetical protein [Roseivivax marinus]|nr:hypothetical protein [Roseivivax marinus]
MNDNVTALWILTGLGAVYMLVTFIWSRHALKKMDKLEDTP